MEIFAPISIPLSLNQLILCRQHDGVVGDILHDHAPGPDADVVSNMDAADKLSACADEHVIADNGRTASSLADSYLVKDSAILTDDRIVGDNDPIDAVGQMGWCGKHGAEIPVSAHGSTVGSVGAFDIVQAEKVAQFRTFVWIYHDGAVAPVFCMVVVLDDASGYAFDFRKINITHNFFLTVNSGCVW